VGREDVLKQLVQAVPVPGASGLRIVVIRGIGGQGKTQLVLQFCRRALEKGYFSAIFWVDASSESTAKKCFESLYEKISGNKQGFMEPDTKVEFVLNTISLLDTPWLLVFDNYDDPILFNNVQDFFPERGQGTIMLTTRRAETAALADDDWFIELPGLGPGDGVALLLKHCQIKPSETINEEALVIVERLGYHALAIAQAGTYINSRRIRLNQFLDHFDRRKELIFQQTPHMSQYRRKLNTAEKDTLLSVFTTWELSFQQLEANDPDGCKARILTLLAFFDCKDVSEKLLKGYCDGRQLSPSALEILGRCVDAVSQNERSHNETLGKDDEYEEDDENEDDWKDEEDGENEDDWKDEEDDEDSQREEYNNRNITYLWNSDLFGDILNDLRQLSLIEMFNVSDDDCYHVVLHPLVSDWIKIRIKDPSIRYKYFLFSSEILCRLIGIVSDLESTTEKYSLTMAVRQAVLVNLNTIQQNFQELLDLQDPKLTLHYPTIVGAFEQFSEFLFDIGKHREALLWYRLVFKLWGGMVSQRSDIPLQIRSDLAITLMHVGEYDEAKDIAKELLDSEQAASLPYGFFSNCARDVLASCLAHQGQYDEAERIYRSLIENVRNSGCKGGIGTFLNNFGNALGEAGKHEAAEQIKKEAREIQGQRFGRFHHLSMEADNNYAMTLKALGRTEEAEQIAMNVLQRSQTALGPEHPLTIEILDTIAQVFLAQGRHIEAKELCQQALVWRETNFGPKHIKTMESRTLMDKLVIL